MLLLVQAMNVVDCPEFRELLLYIGLELEDRDIPHRTKLSELITSRFKIEYAKINQEVQVRQTACMISVLHSMPSLELTWPRRDDLRYLVTAKLRGVHGSHSTLLHKRH